MKRLFMACQVKRRDFDTACAILQGYCAGTAVHKLTRIIFMGGPTDTPKGLKNTTHINKAPHTKALWDDLAKAFAKFSYVVQARYAITPSMHCGPSGVALDYDNTPAVLLWRDIPDAVPGEKRPVLQQPYEEIPTDKALLAALQDNGYRFKNECVEETWSYYHSSTVEFQFVRYLRLHHTDTPSTPATVLPAWSELQGQSLDPADGLLLFVSLYVDKDKEPQVMKQAEKMLEDVRAEFDGIFDFRTWDRRAFDTREEIKVSNMPVPLGDQTVGGINKPGRRAANT